MIKEKEHNPQVSIVPLNAMPLITIPTTGATTSTTPLAQSIDSAEKLTKAVENMSIQTKEIKRLHGQVKALQDQKTKSEASHLAEAHKSQRPLERIQKAERESAICQILAQDKESIWMDIINSINDIWSCIQIIFEQKDLIKKAILAIIVIIEQLGDKPTERANIIKFLN